MAGVGEGFVVFGAEGGDCFLGRRGEFVMGGFRNGAGRRVFAEAAMAAVRASGGAEVVEQVFDQTAVVAGEVENGVDSGDILPFAVEEEAVGFLDQAVQVGGHRQPPVPLPDAGHAERQIAPFFQITQRGDDPLALLAERLGRLHDVQGEPRLSPLGPPEQLRQKRLALGVKVGQNGSGGAVRLELVFAVERAGTSQQAFQFHRRSEA